MCGQAEEYDEDARYDSASESSEEVGLRGVRVRDGLHGLRNYAPWPLTLVAWELSGLRAVGLRRVPKAEPPLLE